MSEDQKIAILQTAFLGDTLLTVPLAKNLVSSEVATGNLALICRKGFGDLFREIGLFGKVIEIEKGRNSTYEAAMGELDSWWSSSSRRILLSPHESARSRIWAAQLRLRSRLSGKSPVITIGYRSRPFGIFSFFYTRKFDRQMQYPEALRQLALMQADEFHTSNIWRERPSGGEFDAKVSGGRNLDGTLANVPDWASMAVGRFLNSRRVSNQVVMAPGSVWATKQWTEDGFVEVGTAAVKLGKKVVLVGSPEEADLCEKIAGRIKSGSSLGEMVQSYAGRLSLVETTDLIASSEIAYVNDSGAMHLASLSGTKTVAFFGPTVLDFGYRPWNNNAVVLETEERLTCRPCGLHGSKTCPVGTHQCMKSIAPNRAIRVLTS